MKNSIQECDDCDFEILLKTRQKHLYLFLETLLKEGETAIGVERAHQVADCLFLLSHC